MRDAFAVLFFVSAGMLLDPAHLVTHPGLVLLTLAVIVVGTPLTAFIIVVACRYPVRVALPVALALAQVGEFSFMVMTVAGGLGLVPPAAGQTIIAAAIASITLNPLLFRVAAPLDRWLASRRTGPSPDRPAHDERLAAEHRAVVVGYGPIGRTVVRLLQENGIRPTVIEMNLDTVRALQADMVEAIYGDATREETLVAAGVPGARSVIVSVAGMPHVEDALRAVRELNPSVQILARTGFLRDAPPLRAAGADLVFSGEGELALAFTAAILERLGATADQIDHERARVHADLVSPSAEGG
jgi:CPA2 family monovalent cation:H+ antiporter-2